MTDALRAAKLHLKDLEAGHVKPREKPSALHLGLIRTLVADLQSMMDTTIVTTHCEQCGDENPKKTNRFCSDKCRALWHREHDPRGRVKAVRRLDNGDVSVIVHFADPDAERALRLMPGAPAVLGELK